MHNFITRSHTINLNHNSTNTTINIERGKNDINYNNVNRNNMKPTKSNNELNLLKKSTELFNPERIKKAQINGVICLGVSYDAANRKLVVWWHNIVLKCAKKYPQKSNQTSNNSNNLLAPRTNFDTSNLCAKHLSSYELSKNSSTKTDFSQKDNTPNSSNSTQIYNSNKKHSDETEKNTNSSSATSCDNEISKSHHEKNKNRNSIVDNLKSTPIKNTELKNVNVDKNSERSRSNIKSDRKKSKPLFPASLRAEVELISARKRYQLRSTKICGPYIKDDDNDNIELNSIKIIGDNDQSDRAIYSCGDDRICFNDIKSKDTLNAILVIRLHTSRSIFNLRKSFGKCYVHLSEHSPHQQETRFFVPLILSCNKKSNRFMTINQSQIFGNDNSIRSQLSSNKNSIYSNLDRNFDGKLNKNQCLNNVIQENLNDLKFDKKQPEILLCIKYNGTTGMLNVTVVRATNLSSSKRFHHNFIIEDRNNSLSDETSPVPSMNFFQRQRESTWTKLKTNCTKFAHYSSKPIKLASFDNDYGKRYLDCYVELLLLSSNLNLIDRARTQICAHQSNPVFKESFSFPITLFQMQEITLLVLVHDCQAKIKRIKSEWISLPTNPSETNLFLPITSNLFKNNSKSLLGWIAFGSFSSSNDTQSHWNDIIDNPTTPIPRWHVLNKGTLIEPWSLFVTKGLHKTTTNGKDDNRTKQIPKSLSFG